jgi:peptide/nickel transport system ATP-binding protein
MRGTRMSMIFQEPMTALNPVMQVGDQIAEVLDIHSDMSDGEKRERVLAVMRSVHLPDAERMIDAYPHQLSGGQRQRIMIAAALVLDPVLLIADEPTTALDVTTQAQILKLIKELRERRNTGVLFITHDFGVVAEIAHRVVVMQHGRVVEQGTTEEVLRRPRHDYTRMLIRSVPSLSPPTRASVAAAPIVLETNNLTKTYTSGGFLAKRRVVEAAKDVNLQVRRGETLGVVGESGSGKSTVARCIARLIEPSQGAILIEGADVAKLSAARLRPHRKRVQIVFQDPYRSLNPRRSVGAAITEGPINFGTAPNAAQDRARQLMRLVGLDPDALERFPHQFSGGQRQRICIARALAMDPEILVADEPVSALDVSVQAQVLELLDDVRKRFNLAVLFITHDLRVAAQVCDRIAVMHKGKVVEEGTTAAVFAAPKHDYTRALFDSAPGKNFEFGKFEV